MKKRTLVQVLSTAAVLATIAVGVTTLTGAGVMPSRSGTALPTIPTAAVQKGIFERTVNSIGELKASKSAIITAPYDGKVIRIVPEGTAVMANDPVIWLDTEALKTRIVDEEAQLLLAQKDLEAAREEYRLQELQNDYNLMSELAKVELAEQREADAQTRYETEKILVERSISAQTKLDEADSARLQAAVELRSARINLRKTEENLASNLRVKQTSIERSQLDVERIQRSLDDVNQRLEAAIIRSPADGEVSYIRYWKGSSFGKITEGDSVWPRLNLMEIPDRSQMVAVVPVNELDIATVQVGQEVDITLDALPNRRFKGVVDRKSIMPIDANQSANRRQPQTTGSTGPKEFEVQVRLVDRDPAFFQGMTATVRIITHRIENSVMVPLEALTTDNSVQGVFRVAGGSAEFVPVKVLQLNDRHATVDANLAENDRVFLRHPNVTTAESRTIAFDTLRRINTQLAEAAEAARSKASNGNGEGSPQGAGERRGPGVDSQAVRPEGTGSSSEGRARGGEAGERRRRPEGAVPAQATPAQPEAGAGT